MIESAVQFAAVFQLLGRLWLTEVNLETLQEMGTNPFLGAYEELGGYLPNEIGEQTTEQLAVEYCSLLIGPKGQISPVESVWTSDQLQSNSASSMHRFFELLPGYQPQSSFADHIGVQLDFAGSLLLSQEDPDGKAEEILNHFVTTHFAWIDDFLKEIVARSQSDFYRGVARVTMNLIDQLDLPKHQTQN